MPKYSIKQNPSFTTGINLPVVGGSPVKVDFTFKYLDREALAAFQQSRIDFAQKFTQSIEENKSGNELAKDAIAYEFKQLKGIIAGWDLEEEYNDDNLLEFVKSSSEIVATIVSGFLNAYLKAREGN